jgi:hypothetical protein
MALEFPGPGLPKLAEPSPSATRQTDFLAIRASQTRHSKSTCCEQMMIPKNLAIDRCRSIVGRLRTERDGWRMRQKHLCCHRPGNLAFGILVDCFSKLRRSYA